MGNTKHVGYGDGVGKVHYDTISPLTRRQRRALKKLSNAKTPADLPNKKDTASLKKLIKNAPEIGSSKKTNQ